MYSPCLYIGALLLTGPAGSEPQILGCTVTPHVPAPAMRYHREPDFGPGALVRVFLRAGANGGPARSELRFDGREPMALVEEGEWAWTDMPGDEPYAGKPLPPAALTVLTFNTRAPEWAPPRDVTLDAGGTELPLALTEPDVWLEALTFMGPGDDVHPDHMVVHLRNASDGAVRLERARLWLPRDHADWTALYPGEMLTELQPFGGSAFIPPGDMGGAVIHTGPLPLTYCALELVVYRESGDRVTLWANQKIRAEKFDISGGWISSASAPDGASTLLREPFLKTMKRLHINTGHIGPVAGYTDDTSSGSLYDRYPIKFFWALEPIEAFDTEEMLPRIHAAEYMGEPQYGGGQPISPQEVFEGLRRYRPTRISSTITLSDASDWRLYAGLSDYPHYDAYRVNAPAADVWWKYEQWGEERIRWAAPLETIGDMTRALREMSRPAPIAYWSQGAGGWDSYDGRQRTSPTPEELRLQAYHALAARITSLYWFNLSLNSLTKFPDLMDPITEVGREIRMLDRYYLTGAAYDYHRLMDGDDPDWDLYTIAGPDAGLLFALDLAYGPDYTEKVFRFGEARKAEFKFRLPAYLRRPSEIFRVDANGVYPVEWEHTEDGVLIRDRRSEVGIYVASPEPGLAQAIEARRLDLVEYEEALGFDPGSDPDDLATLRALKMDSD